MEDLPSKITLNFKLLTGGTFTVSVDNDISVDLLKKIVSKKLKISKERICLMNSERELHDGTLKENGIVNGSKIIVTPNVETGLAQRTENTVMQALESLNDAQVNDFLSGKSPLNLSVRLGDHMMLIQLQLSTLSPSQQNSLKQKVANAAALKQEAATRSIINCDSKNVPQATGSQKRSIDAEEEMGPQRQRMKTEDEEARSPIKSLSSMVSTPLTTTVQNMNQQNNKFWVPPLDPISANLTSCLCKRLNINCNNNCGEQRPEPRNDEPCCSYNPKPDVAATRPIPFHQRPSSGIVIKPKTSTAVAAEECSKPAEPTADQVLNTDNPALAEASRNLTQTLRKLSKRVFTSKTHMLEASTPTTSTSSSSAAPQSSSRNTTSNNTQSAAGSSGAVIESMKHHGKGIYSGTFSGTLNPALQDKNGRPKRDISTIIHILNDLLSATPQCATRNGAKIFFEPTQTSSAPSGKIVKIKKQSSSKASCVQCVPNVTQSRCEYGQCNGHSKTTESTSTSNSCSHLVPSTSTGITREFCGECNQTLVNRKLEIENLKTKNKLDHLKMVMQQKKEKREARKLKIAPYNAQMGIHASMDNQTSSTTLELPMISEMNRNLLMPGSTTSLNESTEETASSSSATATAIATSIPTNNSEIENHLEEVDTAA